MSKGRRAFLKSLGVASVGAAAGLPAGLTSAPARANHHARRGDPDLPRGLVLGTIRVHDEWRLAAKTKRGVLDVVGAAEQFDLDVPDTLDAMFAQGGGQAIENVVRGALDLGRANAHFHAEDAVAFGPCLMAPEKIVMVGLNYRKHVAEVKAQLPEEPLLFNKFNNALLGHGGTIPLPTAVAKEFDYEVELVIVIGRSARDVAEDDALSYVAGYCTGNDVSARDLQRKSSQFMLGKTPDYFAPLGPWLVTADQIPDPNSLVISCHVNGERRQFSNTADMVFNCAQLISYISRHMTLRAGDIIYTGTPEGVIQGYPPDRRAWLKPGDKITCEIEKLGELRFTLT